VIVGSQVDGALDVTPINTAVFSGQRVVLRCHSDKGDSRFVGWNRKLVDGTTYEIVSLCTVRDTFSSVYDVNHTDTRGQCDLVINRVDTSLTGLYTCADSLLTEHHASAYLTIIGQFLTKPSYCELIISFHIR